MNMFCFQCQEAASGTGCTIKGVCGKEPQTSSLMDLLLSVSQKLAYTNNALRNKGLASTKASRLILDALFSTITNANFDDQALAKKIDTIVAAQRDLAEICRENKIELPNWATAIIDINPSQYAKEAAKVGILAEENEDIRSLKQLIIYGVKGAAAYLKHALNLGYEQESLYQQIEEALIIANQPNAHAEELIEWTLKVGRCGVEAMALLDKANTESFGNPEITEVNIGVGKRPGILVSGHDLKDLEELLEQTQERGVDVYTHSEMLPAHYYPAFKKYKHFVGNYGNAWWKQNEEFESFRGVILFTTNCIVPPRKNATYTDRIYTTGASGLKGAKHIEDRVGEGQKDFSQLIAHALKCEAPLEIEKGTIVGGFAHNQVISLADQIIKAVQSGAIKKFVVMAGCDGRMKSRQYYTDFATALPKDNVILTAGCAKYRYNKLELGDIGGIPRVLDAGQCNDSYSLVMIALALKDAFKLTDINELPIVYNIAWYEQKAVIVLLGLLSLGVRNIHLGPTLPAFLSPRVVGILVEQFGIGGIESVDKDIEKWIK